MNCCIVTPAVMNGFAGTGVTVIETSPGGVCVVGRKSSAELGTVPADQEPKPAVTSTCPLASSVAVWYARDAAMLPAGLNRALVGSYSSTDARIEDVLLYPPVTRTSPFVSRVAVCTYRPAFMLPVRLNVPVV